MTTRSIILILCLSLAVTATVSATAGESPQWYLTDAAHPDLDLASQGVLTMTQAAPSDAGTVKVPVGTCVTWASASSAGLVTEVKADAWTGSVLAEPGTALGWPVQYQASVGVHDGDQIHEVVPGHITFQEGDGHLTGLFQDDVDQPDGTFSLPQGTHLTYTVCNPEEVLDTSQDQQDLLPLSLVIGPGSWLDSPPGTDPQPAPELGTFTLATVGLVGMALLHRRRPGL
ncbi:MAG: hypothetical protein R3185_06435 [Candidatus Thermoplasmatota archaeon]|nr:hypothetical protein [Candidatus Thermoplasmatota archaeon]